MTFRELLINCGKAGKVFHENLKAIKTTKKEGIEYQELWSQLSISQAEYQWEKEIVVKALFKIFKEDREKTEKIIRIIDGE